MTERSRSTRGAGSECDEPDTTNGISTELAKLGANDLAYIRPVQIENTGQFLAAGDGQALGTARPFSWPVSPRWKKI